MAQQQTATQAAPSTVLVKEAAFSKILVATDFSPASDRALDFAVSIARRFNSTVYLTHVITLDGYPMIAPEVAEVSYAKLFNEAKLALDSLLSSGRFYGVARMTFIEQGTLWPTIEALVDKHKIDLVVVGTHGASGLKKLVIGSGAEQIFRHARVPVLTVGPHISGEAPFEAEFKHILFATDFRASAEREAAYAFALAQQHRARLTLLNVVPYVEDYSEEAVTRRRNEVVKQLKELLPAGVELTCKPEFQMVIGEPVEEILRWADQTKADLIIMGAKTRKGIVDHAPHPKAFEVVRNARCPVLTIKS